MDRAAEGATNNLVDHSVIGAALVVVIPEAIGEQQAADEISDGDVAVAEL